MNFEFRSWKCFRNLFQVDTIKAIALIANDILSRSQMVADGRVGKSAMIYAQYNQQINFAHLTTQIGHKILTILTTILSLICLNIVVLMCQEEYFF